MVKISSLEIENVKRVKAVALEPSENGLTVIGGRNGQGKTSILDAIAWALGGDKYRPSGAQREGSMLPPMLHVELSNGLIAERRGKNSELKVIDPSGNRAGQTLLNQFVEQFALDLPRFMQSSAKEKADTLLRVIGVGEQLYEMEAKEQQLYNQRHAIGQIADQKKKFAAEMTAYPDAPKEPVSASELIKQQQDILARNGENQRKRQRLEQMQSDVHRLEQQIADLYARARELEEKRDMLYGDISSAQMTAAELADESTAEIERSIAEIEQINARVRANLDREKAEDEARQYAERYDGYTAQIEEIRQQRRALLDNAALPLPGLSVESGELVYNGARWDCMSGADQLRVAAAIVRKLNPECGFVLMDRLEQMDADTLREFGVWLEAEGLQAICTRVSTGDECSIIIEDGMAVDSSTDTTTAMSTAATDTSTAPIKPSKPAGGYWS